MKESEWDEPCSMCPHEDACEANEMCLKQARIKGNMVIAPPWWDVLMNGMIRKKTIVSFEIDFY